MVTRITGLLLIVLLVWAGVTVYNEGVDRAFGGFFARFVDPSSLDAPAERSTPDRAADAFQRAWNNSESRVDRLLDQTGADE